MGGGNWDAVNNGLTRNYIFALAIDPANPMTLYAGANSLVFKSTDGGDNWSNTLYSFFSSFRTLVIDPANPMTLYAGTNGDGVFKSTNGGDNWSAANNGFVNTNILTLAIDPVNPITLYAGTGGGVFKSTDGGSNWSAVNTGLTNSQTR